MEFRQLRYFIAIVDCGSVSRAAGQLYVAQSALSRQLAELEAELGSQLLLRSRNGVALTEAGRIFYDYAKGITKQAEDAKAAVHCEAGAVVGSVVLALPQSVGAMVAMPLFRAAALRLPKLVLHVNEELTGNMADQVLRGRVDLALFCDAMPGDQVHFTPLVEEDFVLLHAAGDRHAPPAGEVTLAQALAHPLVLPSRAHGHCTRSVIDAVIESEGHAPARVAAEINSVHVLKSAVEAGMGWTVMPLGLAQRDVEDGRLVAHPIACARMFRTLGLCVSAQLPLGNAKRAMAQLIEDVLGALCDSGEWKGARRVLRHPA